MTHHSCGTIGGHMLIQAQHTFTILSIAIGVARGGHGRAIALPSLNFALPSKVSKPSDPFLLIINKVASL